MIKELRAKFNNMPLQEARIYLWKLLEEERFEEAEVLLECAGGYLEPIMEIKFKESKDSTLLNKWLKEHFEESKERKRMTPEEAGDLISKALREGNE